MNSYSSSWERNFDLLANALQSLDRKTASIRRSTNKVVSIKDINKERERVKQATSTANSSDVQVIQDQLRQVERLIKLDSNLNMGDVKLINEAKSTLNAYQSACDKFYRKCIAVEEASREKKSSRTLSSLHDRSYAEEGDSTLPLLKDGSAATAKTAFEDDLYQEIMAERVKETQEIADSVKDIHEIFVNINEMVEEQGGQLETVNANVSASERATFNANENLRRAHQYQENSYSNKLLLIFVIFMFVITFIALFSS
ncbi:unnamed protein product [Phytomonas sp. EM1]|nr:unnamed protein product [Phytomonas sp. EM1]|eukprot:CCW59531.1 unnamed protein product [Phytomonas sp. isolate EM1]